MSGEQPPSGGFDDLFPKYYKYLHGQFEANPDQPEVRSSMVSPLATQFDTQHHQLSSTDPTRPYPALGQQPAPPIGAGMEINQYDNRSGSQDVSRKSKLRQDS